MFSCGTSYSLKRFRTGPVHLMIDSSSKSVFRLARVAALLSLAVVVFGETMHLYQECDCCETLCSVDQELVTSCPFGCEHHGTETPENSESGHQSGHDEESCSICFLLGQAPQETSIVEVPSLDDSCSEAFVVASESTHAATLLAPVSRGPPSIG